MEKFKKFLWYQFPAIICALAIFIQSSMSNLKTPDLGFSFQDKIAHLLEYAIFGFFLIRSFVFQNNEYIARNWKWIVFITGSLYAVSDEIHQYFVPGRFAALGDVIADILGVVISIIIFIQVQKKQKQLQFNNI